MLDFRGGGYSKIRRIQQKKNFYLKIVMYQSRVVKSVSSWNFLKVRPSSLPQRVPFEGAKLSSKHIEILLNGGLSRQRPIVIGQTGKFSLTKPGEKGLGSHSFSRLLALGLVPFQIILNATLFIAQIICPSKLYTLMRNNHHMTENKPEGFIVRRSEQKIWQEQPRTLSLERPLRNDMTITSNQSMKIPGQIRKGVLNGSRKVDEEVYYNADVYTSRVKKEETVVYSEECQNVLPVRREKREIQVTPVTNNSKINSSLQSIEEEGLPRTITNIHGQFDLLQYHQLYSILKSMISALTLPEVELTLTLSRYINHIKIKAISDFSDIKLTPSKKQLLNQSFMRQRQAVIMLCLVIAINKRQKIKSYCSNLLKYAFENYLVSLNILVQNGEFAQKMMRESGKNHLLDKGFQFLRSNNQIMNDLIVKIAKVDPLYAEEYFKIRDNWSNSSLQSFLFAQLSFFAFYINAIRAEQTLPFLALAPSPFIQEPNQKEYTLVIDFMRVFLDHSGLKKTNQRRRELSIRPYSSYFLKEMAKYYQIISFSNAMPVQCSKIISRVDEYRVVKHKLFKYHIDQDKKQKEMEKIGRPMDRLIMMDTVEDENNKNLLLVNSWKGDPSSNAQLAEICPMLAMIAVKEVATREAVRKIRDTMASNSHLGLKYINCGVNL